LKASYTTRGMCKQVARSLVAKARHLVHTAADDIGQFAFPWLETPISREDAR
jgi:hypothetical protein